MFTFVYFVIVTSVEFQIKVDSMTIIPPELIIIKSLKRLKKYTVALGYN